MTPCSTHPRQVAAWECMGCGRGLCEDCGARDYVAKAPVVRCTRCARLAQPVYHYLDIAPFWRMVGPFFRSMLAPEGLLQLVAVGAVLLLFDLMLLFAPVFQIPITVAWLLYVVGAAAEGEETIPDGSSEKLQGIFQGIGALLIATIPLLMIWSVWYGFTDWEPGFWILLTITALVLPAAIITAATAEDTLELLHPGSTINVMLRGGTQYLYAALLWNTLMVVHYVFMGAVVIPVLSWADIPLVGSFLFHLLSVVIPTVASFVLGRLVWQNGELFGVLTTEDRRVPQVVDPVPRGELPRIELEEAPLSVDLDLAADVPDYVLGPVPVAVSPGGFSTSDDETYDLADDPSAEELPMDLGLARTAEVADVNSFAAALRSDDHEHVVRLYREMERVGSLSALGELPESVRFRLAVAFEHTDQHADAARAYQAVAEAGGALAGEAVLALGHMLLVGLGLRDRGLPLIRLFLERFPEHPRRAEAEALLAQTT